MVTCLCFTSFSSHPVLLWPGSDLVLLFTGLSLLYLQNPDIFSISFRTRLFGLKSVQGFKISINIQYEPWNQAAR